MLQLKHRKMLNFAKDLLLFGYILLFAVRPAKLLLSAYRQNGMGTKKRFLMLIQETLTSVYSVLDTIVYALANCWLISCELSCELGSKTASE